jgi:hypothetical protein
MSVDDRVEQRLESLIDKLCDRDKESIEYVEDLLRWGLYGQDVFSQFGLGLSGFVFRQRNGSTLLTVKATEAGVPLVAFVTSATTRGCVEQMFDLLYAGRLKWQRDKYPWI